MASRPFRKRAFGNGVVIVVVVRIGGIVMQRPDGVRRDPLLEFFDVQQNCFLSFHRRDWITVFFTGLLVKDSRGPVKRGLPIRCHRLCSRAISAIAATRPKAVPGLRSAHGPVETRPPMPSLPG